MSQYNSPLSRFTATFGSIFGRGKPRLFDSSVHKRLKEGLGVDLPADYLEFLLTFDGEVPERGFFWVVPGDWGSSIDSLYLMTERGEYPSLLMALDWDGLPLKPGLVPIGGDGCFGYILLSVRPEDHGSVYFCTTWSDDGHTDYHESQGYWKLADSFSTFMAALGDSPDKD